MTLDQALEVLGLTDATDARAIKRAYHKRLKRTKPDRDPEGFRRLREAFEVASAWSDDVSLGLTGPAPESSEVRPLSPLEPKPQDPPAVERVHEALDEGRIDDAVALVLDPAWSSLLLDDLGHFGGPATWATMCVAKVAILAKPSAFDALQTHYADLLRSTDIQLGMLLTLRGDWEHLLAHSDVPAALFDLIALSPGVHTHARRIELGRAVGQWYWRDPDAAWDTLIAVLTGHGALGPYVFELLEAYEDLVDDGATLPVETQATPREALRPLTVPFALLTCVAVGTVLVLLLPDDAGETSMLAILGRYGAALLTGVFMLSAEVFVYRLWRALRRRFLHACFAHGILPEDAAWAITGHVFLQHAVFGDALLQLAHRVGRLAGLATPRADED